MKNVNEMTVKDVIALITPKVLMERLGVSKHAISFVLGQKDLPLPWFIIIEDEFIIRGLDRPDHLFTKFRRDP